jgi:hypothetical protein
MANIRTRYKTQLLTLSQAGIWPLNESSGTIATDVSGNSLNGTYEGSFSLGQSGPAADFSVESALFDGSSAYVNLGSPSQLNITGQVNLSAWVNVASFPTSGNLMAILGDSLVNDGDNVGYFMDIYNNSGTIELRIGSYKSPTGPTYGATWNISGWSTGQWVFVVGNYDLTNWNLYFNGASVSSTSLATGALTNSSLGKKIGVFDLNGSFSRYLNGKLCFGTIGAAAWTAAQVTEMYHYMTDSYWLHEGWLPIME